LIALNGLAQVIANKIGCRNLADIVYHRNQLYDLQQLLGEPPPLKGHRRVKPYRAPSWSWASAEGPDVPFMVQETDLKVILISQIQQINIKTAPGDRSHQVIGGSLFITGLFVPGNIISWKLWTFSWDDPIDQVSNERESMTMVGQATASFRNQATNLHYLV
jgi:hypothetical protein